MSNLNRIHSTVSTTKHCLDCAVSFMSSNDIQSSDVGVLVPLVVWRYLSTDGDQSHVHGEFTWIVDWEWEVGLYLERDFGLQHRRSRARNYLGGVFVDWLHLDLQVLRNNLTVDVNNHRELRIKISNLIKPFGKANHLSAL